MFDRAGLKLAAKNRVSQKRWMAVLVCFIASLCGAFRSGGGMSFSSSDSDSIKSWLQYDSLLDMVTVMVIALSVAAVVLLFAIAFTALVTNVIAVGLYGWFLDYSRGADPSLDVMFSRFNHYKSTVLGMLLRDVYTFLWSLLFVIPGLIKMYAYALVPFLLYENPSLSAKQAIRISETMMDGWKWEMFVFDLSFIGWYILNVFTCGILGVLFINPFYYTAHAMLYDNIKYHAVYNRGVVDPSLLNMPASPAYQDEPTAEY